MDFDKRIVTLKELQRVVNELEQKAFDNEKKVSDLEHSLQSHILQYNLRMKTEKRARTNPTQLLKQTFIEGSAGEEQIGGPQSKFKKAVTLTAGRISAQRRSINAFNTLLSDIRNEGGQTSDQHDTDAEAVAAQSKANSKGLILNPIPTQLSKSIEIPEELVHQIEERVCNSQPIKRMIIENIQRLQNDLDAKLREQLELMRPKESMNLKDKMAKQLKEKMQQGVIQQQNEAISKLKEDFAQLNTKISELQTISTVIQRQQTTSSQDQRPMTADSVIPQPNEKSGTKQSEVVNMSGDAKNGNLFRSLKSSSNISSDGQNTNASEEVRTKPPMQVSSSLIPNNRIFESLKGKLEHLDQQKVDIYEFEMLKGQMLQRISELELSASIDIKDSQKRVDHQFLEVNENIRKLRDFMLQIKESARITEVPYAKKTETEETYKRLEKRIDMLTDTVMRNSIGPLQEVMMKQPIKNNSHNQSANGQNSSENINEQNSQLQGEPVTVTEHEDRSPARFSPMSGRGRNLIDYKELQRQRLNNTTLEPQPLLPSGHHHNHNHQHSNDGCLDCLAVHAYRRGHNRNGYLQKKTTAKSGSSNAAKQMLRQSLKGPLTQTLMGQQQIFKQKDALAQAAFLQDTYQLLYTGGLGIKVNKKGRVNRLIDTAQPYIQHEINENMSGQQPGNCNMPHHRNIITAHTATHSPKKVRDSWSNMPPQNKHQPSVFYNPRDILSEEGYLDQRITQEHVSFGAHKYSAKPASYFNPQNQKFLPKNNMIQVNVTGREQQSFKVRTNGMTSPNNTRQHPPSQRENATIHESDENPHVASPLNLKVNTLTQ